MMWSWVYLFKVPKHDSYPLKGSSCLAYRTCPVSL